MSIKAVIFDRDGVLTDFDLKGASAFFQPILPFSLDELFYRWQKWGEKVGFPSSVAEEKEFFRGLWNQIDAEVNFSQSDLEQLNSLDYTRFVHPYLDVKAALEAIKQRGLRIGVLSNFSLATLEASLESAGLADLVDVACAATVIGYAKPDPNAYLTVTKALAIEPKDCLFFDDEIECIEGGQAVGLRSYLVDRSRSEHALAENIVCDLSIVPSLI